MADETLKAQFSIDTGNAEKALSGVESKVGGMGKGLATATKAFAGVTVGIAAAGAAAFKFTDDYTKKMDAIDKGSQRMSLSAEAYQEWDYVLSQNGASIGNMEIGMKTLTKQMEAAGSGNDEAMASFQRLGVELKNTDGSYRSLEEMLPDVISGLSKMDQGVERNALASKLFGRSGQELLPLLNQQRGSIDELRGKYKELGMGISNDGVKQGAAFQDTMDTMNRQMTALFGTLAVQLIPIIMNLFESITPLIPVFLDLIKTIVPLIEDVMPVLVDLVTGLIEALTPLLKAVLPVLAKLFTAVVEAIVPLLEEILPILVKLILILADFLVMVLDALVPLIPVFLDLIIAIMPLIEMVLPLLELLLKGLAWLIQNVIVPVIEFLAVTFTAVINTVVGWIQYLKDNSDSIFTAMAESISNIWNGIKDFFLNLWETVKTLFMNAWNFIKDIFFKYHPVGILFTHWDSVAEWFGTLWNKVKEIFSATFSFLKKIFFDYHPAVILFTHWDTITGYFSGIWDKVKASISEKLSAIAGILTGIWGQIYNGITTSWTNIMSNISKWVENIRSKVVNVFQAMVKTLGGVWSGIAGIVKVAFNSVISVVNGAIRALNRVSISIPDWVPGMGGKSFGFSIPQIPMLADGGIVNSATLAIIGESGPEAVVPLDRLNQGSGETTIIIQLDGRIIAESTVKKMPSVLKMYGLA